MKPAPLHRAQQAAAKWAAGISLLGNAILVGLSLWNPGRFGVPPVWLVVITLAPTAVLALLLTRNVRFAPHALVWYWGLAIPLLMRDPFLNQRAALAIFGPVALATFLTGAPTIVAMAVVPLSIVILRADGPSPYVNVGYLIMFAILTTILVATRRMLDVVIKEATKSSSLFEALARETNEIITITGPGKHGDEAKMKYMSPSVTRVLGYPAEGSTDLPWADVMHPEDLHKIETMSLAIRSKPGHSATEQFRMRHKEGGYRWVVARGTNLLHLPEVEGVLSTFVDVTPLVEGRDAAENRLEYQAHHDAATGLPNRRKLQEMLHEALESTKHHGVEHAVLFIDIDGFKVVNDSLGHDFGDLLITHIAERLGPELPEDSTIFRFGGDELVVLSRASGDVATDIANRLVESTRKPFQVGERDVFVTASVGVASLRSDHDRPEAVLKDADLAMYRAKERGRDRCERFDDDMRRRAERRHELEQALRCALDANEISIAYQPKVSAIDGKILGFEALARWNSARLGRVTPAEFIPLAEETGLIEPIGAWVLAQAGAQLKAWQTRAPRLAGLKMAVNLSGRQLLGHDDFEERVREVLEKNAVLPWCLELEITESVLMTNAAKAIERLERLKKLGVKLAIDDFGTGYSSLSYLRRFPVDVLKIDRAFVTGLGNSREDSAIVHLILTLAQALGLETVAEGVETHEQLADLRALGCDQIQGFLVSQPLDAEDATALLERSYGLPVEERLRAAAE